MVHRRCFFPHKKQSMFNYVDLLLCISYKRLLCKILFVNIKKERPIIMPPHRQIKRFASATCYCYTKRTRPTIQMLRFKLVHVSARERLHGHLRSKLVYFVENVQQCPLGSHQIAEYGVTGTANYYIYTLAFCSHANSKKPKTHLAHIKLKY